ncbi:unnamed protein product, partial [marine sediment metagenome]
NRYTLVDGIYDIRVSCTDTGGANATAVTREQVLVYESPSAMRGAVIDADIAEEAQQTNTTKFVLVIAGLYGLYWLLTRQQK